MKLTRLAKEIFPASELEGWGNVVFSWELKCSANISSGLNNCGVGFLGSVTSSWSYFAPFSPTIIPEAVRSKYADPWGRLNPEYEELLQATKDNFIKENQTELFKEMLKVVSSIKAKYHCIVLSDGVNKHNPVRGIHVPAWTPSSAWFARKLIEHKEGYIVQSPIAVNAVHMSPTDFGYVRVWIWFPKEALAFKPERLLGYGTLLTKDQVKERIEALGNFKPNKLSKYKIEDYIDSYKV